MTGTRRPRHTVTKDPFRNHRARRTQHTHRHIRGHDAFRRGIDLHAGSRTSLRDIIRKKPGIGLSVVGRNACPSEAETVSLTCLAEL